ncbi:condensation domain-containing protein [Actinokineospora sp. 24-640]
MTVSETSPASQGLGGALPLSLNQEFLCAFDKGEEEGAFCNRHTLVYGWRITGAVDTAALRLALDDVVVRHESLRTVIERAAEPRHQVVHPPMPVPLGEHELPGVDPAERETRAEEFLNEMEARAYPVGVLPHLWAELARFDGEDSILVLATHHTATDAWSMGVIMRDVARCYARRLGFDAELPEVTQYGEFAAWQHSAEAAAGMAKPQAYWKAKLDGAEIQAVPTDRPRSADKPNSYAVHRFTVPVEIGQTAVKFGKSVRSSPFMVLLAAYKVVLSRRTGVTDLVVPTFTSGRYQPRFLDSVGPFFNFVALRTDLTGAATFREVVERTRGTCIESYTNDIPFPIVVGQAPGVIAQFARQDHAVIAFEILQSPADLEVQRVGGLTITELRRRVLSQRVASAIPDGGLWAMDVLPSGELVGSLKYDTNLVDESTAVALVTEFVSVLAAAVAAPDAPLQSIE